MTSPEENQSIEPEHDVPMTPERKAFLDKLVPAPGMQVGDEPSVPWPTHDCAYSQCAPGAHDLDNIEGVTGLGAPLELTPKDAADIETMYAEPDHEHIVGGWERPGTCGSETVLEVNGQKIAVLTCNEDAGHDLEGLGTFGKIEPTPHRASVLWGNLPIAQLSEVPAKAYCGNPLPGGGLVGICGREPGHSGLCALR